MKNTKIVALVATVALLVLGAAFTSMAATYNWYQQDDEWRCKDKNGDDIYDAWAKSGADWYWLNDEGFMAREALVDGDTKYVDADGKMVKNDWKKVVDDENNEHWMYFQAGGKKMVGKDTPKPVTVKGKKYIFDTNGYMMSGWVNDGDYDQPDEDNVWTGAVYFCGDAEDGAVTYGWRQIEVVDENAADTIDQNYWFYFQPSGKKVQAKEDCLTEKTVNGKKYAFNDTGAMVAEWEAVYATQATASSTDIMEYAWFHTVEDGSKLAKGWFRVIPAENVDGDNNAEETAKWFYAKGGKLCKNCIKTINGKKYGFNDKGEMVVGLCAAEVGDSYTDVTFLSTAIDAEPVMTAAVTNGEYDKVDYSGAVLYYFSADEDNDGSMKTGAQTVTVDGDDYNFYFSTKNVDKGMGITRKQGNKFYYNGKKVAADDSVAEFQFFDYDATLDAVSYEANTDPDTVKVPYGKDGEIVNAVNASKYKLIGKTGTIATSGTKKDGNGNKYVFKKVAKDTAYPDGVWILDVE